MKKQLTDRESAFITAYVSWPHRGIYTAARAAGYRGKLSTAVSRLVARPMVMDRLELQFQISGKPMPRTNVARHVDRAERDRATAAIRRERIARRRTPARLAGAARARAAKAAKRVARLAQARLDLADVL